MRLKVAPGDFRVRESLDFVEDRNGPYFIHRLRKEKLDTLEAIRIVAAEARVDRAKIAFAGLKDRQGVTEQWISIEGTRLDYRGRGIECRFFGRSAEPLTSKLSQGNEFAIVVRDLDRHELETFERRLPELRRAGFANYFDDQRFATAVTNMTAIVFAHGRSLFNKGDVCMRQLPVEQRDDSNDFFKM